MPGLDWLTARPVAHRGLHDVAHGIIENTATAVAAAVAGNYAIEVDLQVTADGEAMVYHDDALGRLTNGGGQLAALTAAQLRRVPFRATEDRMISLGELCDLVAGRSPLVIELKSRFDGDRRVVDRAVTVLAGYAGPVALMSFDPQLVDAVREKAPGLPRGIVAESRYRSEEHASGAIGGAASYLRHALRARPHFIAYAVRDLPAAAPLVARWIFGLPLLTWTVRTEADQQTAQRWADQMIFEGFRP